MSVPSLDVVTQTHVAWAVPLSVLIASFAASPHCAVMCGPLALNFARQRSSLIAYQLGRLLGYTTMGALAGALGESVLHLGRFAPLLSSLSLGFIGLSLLIMGWRTWKGRPLHMRLPALLGRLLSGMWSGLRRSHLPKNMTASLAGALTVFLPCGHLYAFLVGSVATGSALGGAVFMAAFWLGTVPALALGTSWIAKILKPGFQQRPGLAATLLVVAGLFSLLAFATRLPHLDAHLDAHLGHETQRPGSSTESQAVRCH